MASFELGVRYTQRITGLRSIALSLAQHGDVEEKRVTDPQFSSPRDSDRIPAQEHLARLIEAGRCAPDRPTLMLSVRNVLSNLRCVGYVEGLERPAAVAGEVMTADRPYHILGLTKEGELVIREFAYGRDDLDAYAWFLSAVPVAWDDEGDEHLLERITTEAADHSHVWRIPRGRHPDATEETRRQWEELHEVFAGVLGADRATAAAALSSYAQAQQLAREDGYLHNVLGLDGSGQLCQLIGQGRLEGLGRSLGEQYGVRRALCVDNGGSIEVRFLPKGAANGEYTQLVSLPSFRPPGTAYLGIQLEDKSYTMLP